MKLAYHLIVLSVFLLPARPVSAQQKPFDFGFLAGPNLSTLSFENPGIPPQKLKAGIHLGLTGNYHLSNGHFFIQTGLAFATKGSRIKGDPPLGFPSDIVQPGRTAPVWESNLMYLQVPVSIGYKIPVSAGRQLLFRMGPYASYGFAGKTRLSAAIRYGDYIDDTPLEENAFGGRGLLRTDYGAGGGVGLRLPDFSIWLNYEHGLRNIGPAGSAYIPFYETGYRNRNLSLLVEFKL